MMARMKHKEAWLGWSLVLVPLAFLAVFMFYPMVYALVISFFNWKLLGPKRFVGFANFRFLFTQDTVFLHALVNTLIFTFFNLIGGLGLALGAALLVRRQTRSMKIFRTVLFTPVVIPLAIAGVIWRLLYEPSFGFVNAVLQFFHIAGRNWLFDAKWALPAVILVSIWQSFGLYTIILVGGLQQIPVQLYEVMALDGANRRQIFRYLTLPLLKPTLFFVSTVLMINSFKMFDQAWVMTQGGPGTSTTTLVLYVYQRIFDSVGLATAASIVLFLLVLMLVVVQYKVVGGDTQ